MKIAIAGFGLEGKANYEYWKALGHDLTIVDEREQLDEVPAGAATMLGPDAFSKLEGFDMVVRTAGLNPHKIHTDGKVWSSTNEFFVACPAPIIGVTGTKGKGTTASLIAGILRAAGREVHLVGNIGVSALGELPSITPDGIVVFELSSFQLWDAERSPHTAVVLGIEPDHLNVHASMAEYVEAKAQVAAHQTPDDVVIFNADNEYSQEIAQRSPGRKLGYLSGEAGHIKDGTFYYQDMAVCPTDSLQIAGYHNQENAAAAISAVWEYTQDTEAIERGLKGFAGLPHRLKLVREVRGIRYFDDSIATTPSSAMAAIRAFSEEKVIILGGQSKGGSYDELLRLCEETGTKVIAIGSNGRELADRCAQLGVVCRYVDGLIDEVVRAADEIATAGDVVLLSPATASFDQYQSYADRGDQFAQAVNQLAAD